MSLYDDPYDPEPERHTPWEPSVELPPAPQEPEWYDDGPSFCRGTWKGKPCTDPAVSHGYCDIHLEKYS